MAKTYWVSDENDFLHERPIRSLDKAKALAAKAAEECSWKCLTPPAPDNEVRLGKGNFRCGTLAAHGVHIRASEDGHWTEEYDIPEEKFRRAKVPQQADWALWLVIDRGTGYLADGEDTFYFTGPEQTDSGWDKILDDIAGGDEIMEAKVAALAHGRYSHLIDGSDYPMVWKQGQGF